MDQPQFSKLLEKINNARNARKNQKEKAIEKLSFKSEEFCTQSPTEEIKGKDLPEISKEFCFNSQMPGKNVSNEVVSKKSEVIHPKHDRSRQEYVGQDGMLNFQEVDFPDYKNLFNQISIAIK